MDIQNMDLLPARLTQILATLSLIAPNRKDSALLATQYPIDQAHEAALKLSAQKVGVAA